MSTQQEHPSGSGDEHWTHNDGNRRPLLLRQLSRLRAFGLKPTLWRIGSVIASTTVVTFAMLYVVEPTSSAMTLKDRIGGYAPPGSVVLYGSVLNGQDPIIGAQITVTQDSSGGNKGHDAHTTGKVVGSESTDDQGTYRLQLFVSPGTYAVDITLANGKQHGGFQFQLGNSNSANSSGNQQGNNVYAPNTETAGFISHSSLQSIGRRGDNGGNGDTGYGNGNGDRTGTTSSGGYGEDGSNPGDNFRLVSADQVLGLEPGLSYDVSAQVTTSNFLSFLPVSSY